MDLDDKTANGKRRLIGERVIDGFRSHVTREYTSIGGETSDNYTDMVIDFEDRNIDFLTLLSQSVSSFSSSISSSLLSFSAIRSSLVSFINLFLSLFFFLLLSS